jgi:flagellar basal-body rod protein FlgB
VNDLFGGVAFRALHQGLNGLALRQRTIADNLANVETPGFLAGKVDFETSLRDAVMAGEDPLATSVAKARSLEPTRTNGSNVNLDEESLASMQTLMTIQLATQALTGKFQTLRTAISGQ